MKVIKQDKLPAELHIIRNEKNEKQREALADKIKKKFVIAEWLDDPSAWDEKNFINETADFLSETYGMDADQDRHLVSLLAQQISLYIRCQENIRTEPIVMVFNDGKTMGANPYISVARDTLGKIIALMQELGLTPKGRLNKQQAAGNQAFGSLLNGPQVKK